MDSIARLSAFFCIFFTVETTLAAENGYILFETPNITCKDPSSAKSPCSSVLNYKIPESNNDSFIPDLSYLANLIPNTTELLNSSAGEQCSKAGAKYLCQVAYPFRCDDEYIEVDGKEQLASCNESRKNCSSLTKQIRDAFFNCSIIASNPNYQHKIPRKLNCEAFPALNDDPYNCNANYKVYAQNASLLRMVSDHLVHAHNILKNAKLHDMQCEKNVADAICKASIPACSNDQTKAVSILSRQNCRNIMGCVNQTKNKTLIQGTHGICDGLPDSKTAKPYPLYNVFENMDTTTSAPTPNTKTSNTSTVQSNSQNVVTNSTSRPTRPTSQATQLDTIMYGMVFLVGSILPICTWL